MQFISRVIQAIGHRLIGLGNLLAPSLSPQPLPPSRKEIAHDAWLQARGDKTLRLETILKPSDVVFDIGGYEGQWASDVYAMNLCTVHVFEPVLDFADELEKRFARNASISVHPFGLGGNDAETEFYIQADASSAHVQTEDARLVRASIRAFDRVCTELGVSEITLMKINIEGGEYELLEHLISSGWIDRVQTLHVQFHDFVDNAESRMETIKKGLASTHKQIWEFPFIWEAWRRKDLQS